MIISISNGRTITPIYFPQPVVLTNSIVPQQSNNTRNSEPTLATWIVLGVLLIFLIISVTHLIKLSKKLFGDKK